MPKHTSVRQAVRLALVLGALPVGLSATTAFAQEQDAAAGDVAEIIVTGTRIRAPGIESSSPILTVTADQIQQFQTPEVGQILNTLPSTLIADNGNANNGTAGAITVDLRGLGSQRNLILIDGKRITPYNFNGIVDLSVVPTALIERVDIVTGGASAVYGSDAMSGAINFIMKKDFEGIAIDSNFSQTTESDGKIKSAAFTLGTNVADGRGNVVMSVNWSERDGVQLGARPLGQLGIVTEDGGGYQEFLNGELPPPPGAGCEGTGSVGAGGSTTTVPTRVAIAGGPGLGQFRNDGTLGANCSVFNFNPFNYYQTPQERFGGIAIGSFEVNEHAEAYGRLSYSSTTVRQQVAPSGIFGSTFFTPLANPFISAQARTAIITAANAGVMAGTVTTTGALPNWNDVNNDGVVDAGDDLLISYRRRTVELGERSTTYDNKAWQFLTGIRGELGAGWDWDVSYQRGEATRSNVSAGYTNVANIQNAVNAVSTTTCRTGGSACVPINLFGGLGSITPEMAAYSGATAIEKQVYTQSIVSASVSGLLDQVKLPTATSGLALSFGAEYREEEGVTTPDECLKLAPASCLGGAGGNTLPIAGGFDVKEFFTEAILPLVDDRPGIRSLDLELGYRFADYDPSGTNRTWKYGLNYKPIDTLMFRAMKQRAARAPNVGELAAPQVTNLDNANLDPCSIANAMGITSELQARCIATGMTAAQVGTVENLVSGQVNIFTGTDLVNLPKPESADTLTLGVVWTPVFDGAIRNMALSVDYYDIKIDDYIGTFGSQETLDGCYVGGVQSLCNAIQRVGGTLTLPGSGIQEFTTNLKYLQAEGIELDFSFGVDIGNAGRLTFRTLANHYLTQESQSSDLTEVIDCAGFYGTFCTAPLPKTSWLQRVSWDKGPVGVSLLWRHKGSSEIEPAQYAPPNDVFPEFRKIDAYNYFDLSASYDVTDNIKIRASMNNVTDEDPPVVGNEAADTRSNSGNTFPGAYDTLGRVYAVGVNVRF
ncbi:MAG TPA: TonB-dependent receptor [Steroidobacteraceae bacterium]|nr:TonB-dependent receptor [Steroidobacteraceae bacterium]HRX88331.1 TonB-dependent receptor [Steroidobacteraceae bacterium]